VNDFTHSEQVRQVDLHGGGSGRRAMVNARSFITAEPPCIAGHGGHNQLFKVVCALVARFNLPLLEVWKLLLEFNTRCRPRWSKVELIHKLVDAHKTIGVQYDEADLMADLPFESDTSLMDDDDGVTPAPRNMPVHHTKPARDGFGLGSDAQLQRLASLRGISVAGLRWAMERGMLVFGFFAGQQVYGVTDSSGEVLEVRRLDGKSFPAVGNLSERKSHALRGSSKRHPVGIDEAKDFSHILITEGIPDFLATHDLIIRESVFGVSAAMSICAPVALLSANVAIDDASLPIFKGKFVRIFYHHDESGAGWTAARRWQQQIVKAGAFSCDFFHFKNISSMALKDLNEFIVALDAGLIGSDQHPLHDFIT
jgi:hypothetical protein